MRKFMSSAIGAAIFVAACGGSAPVFDGRVAPETVVAAVEKDLGITCVDEGGDATIRCDRDDPQSMMIQVTIQIYEEEGVREMSLISIDHSSIERQSTVNLLKRFGFSESDFDSVTKEGQRLTVGDFTMDAQNRQEIVIYAN
ncbi:putative lipoprotein [Hyphomonas neptunium ATCC 15444]|uniref:Putative lipoprotein n=2 Tax=Hyphomonas TaxID=85 RepID=Q0BXW0_HYPNA|nr:putative lipoprotein [Hyphomonas neptunium ATCC 15444]